MAAVTKIQYCLYVYKLDLETFHFLYNILTILNNVIY
jgi:hypothetical protein